MLKDINSEENDIELLLEVVMGCLLECPYTFDGVTGLIANKRKPRQIVFEGKIWVVENTVKWNEKLEPFTAIVTDKWITKQGIHIKIWFREEVKEGDILEIFC